MEEETRVLQIGGIAGLLAGVLFLLIFPLILVLPPPLPGGDPDPDTFLGTIFPENQATFAAIGILALVGYLLTVALFLALHRSLRKTSPTVALGGLLLYLLYIGFLVVAPGELVAHLVITPQLADLYALGGTEAGRAVQTFHVLGLLSDQMFFAGLLFGFLSVLLFGTVMWRSGDYGRIYGGIILLLGLIGIATLQFITSEPGIRVPHVPHVLWFILGWKVYALSRAAGGTEARS